MTLGELRAQRNGGGITLGELRQRRFGSQPSTEKEDEDNDWNYADIPVIGPVIKNAADTLTSQIGLQAKGLGMELQALADTADKNNNPNVNSGLYRTAGGALSDFGGWLENKAAEGEKYHPSQEWSETSLSDIISDPEALKRYATDPQGFQAELGSGIGSGLGFAALARLFPSFAAEKVASKALEPASKLLGNIGLNKAAQAVGSNTAKELLGSSVQFGSTMGPAGALTNAATIIDSLKEQGLSDAEIAERMNSLIGEELPADIAFAALTGNVAKGQLGKLAPQNSSAFQKAMANAAGIPLEAAGGYYSNVNQMILSDKYSGKPYGTLTDPLPNESTAGRLGILAGLPFSIYGARQGYQNATGQTNDTQNSLDQNKSENDENRINFAAGLQSARKSLDGKQMDNGTVGCVEAVTKILSHVHPEFKKMVDDGVVNTVEGENSLHSRLEKMGVEIIPFDESQVAQGDIIFYDGKQTYQHVLVADHKDADGNWRVFGNSSSANKVMEQPLYQGQTPAWIAKVSNLQGNKSSQGQIQQQPQQQEQTKPSFDINAEDETTQKLLDKFANERFNEAINKEDEDDIKFFNGMFDDKDAFQNTPENRNAVIERYGEELSKFIQDNSAPETQTQSTAQPATSNSNVVQTDNPYQKNAAIKSTANNFLEQLRAEGDQNKGATLFKLQNALNKGNFAEVENILKQNNVAIPQPQQAQPAPIQQNPVKENKPPENILTQPANTSGNEKLIKQASKIITKRTSHEGKKRIGDAILRLANQNGISVPAVDFKSLQNGSSKKIAEWQAKLSQAGAFAISPPQTSTSNKTSANEAVESKTAEGTTVFTPQSVIQAQEQKKNSLKYRAQQVLNKLSAQHTKNVLREREADLSNDETNEAVPFDYFNYVNDDEAPSPAELQRQENEKTVQKYQAQQEEYRQWQAKQNKELEELKARQAEEKPLRDEARQEEEQRRNGTQTQGQPQAQSQVKTAPTVQESDEQEVQPKSQETVEQEQPSNIKEYHASDYDTHVVFHGRKSPDAPERPTDGKSIADALKAIVQAPAGTRIEGKYAFQVEPDVFEIKDRAGRKMIGGVYSRHRPVVLNPANAYKFFGNAREVRVIYPKEKNETPIQPSEVTTPESTTESQEGEIRQNNTVANSDNAEVSDNKSVQQSEETNEAEDLFVVGEGQYPRNGENYYTAKVDSSKLPLGRLGDNADYRLRRLAERYSQQDKFSRGTYKFSSAQARDSFIKDVKNSQILSREVESQRPFSKIFNDAKEEAYRILEADKYPEIKDWLDRQTKNQVDTIVMTGDIEKASEFAEELVKSVKSHKDAGKLANSVLYENLNKWETTKRSTSRGLSGKLREKYNKAQEIIKEYTERYKKGEVTIEDAREDLNHFLKTGRRIKATKPSVQGEVDTAIDNFVDDKDLTPQQKLQQDFGKKLGVQTIFFNNENGDFHGAHANGTSYINVNSKMPISKVFWHEAMHWLKANNPKLYNELVKATGITTDQRQAYLRETGRKDIRTPDEINEEILADKMEDVAKRSGLLQSIAGKNHGLIERVVQWLKDTMNKFIDHFRNPSGKLTTKQSIALADEFGRIAKDLVDPNGDKIFRYNNRTQNIEPIGGRSSSESVRNSSEPKPPPAGAIIKYSIDNDNSNESLVDKIKNKLSWFSGDKKTIRRKKVITAKLRELSGYRILYGNVKGANDVVVDHMQKLIQSRNTYDWNKLLPVVSKEIAKNLKLNPTAEQSNLIADWLLTGALNNTSAEMKAFQKAMRDNPAMADILLETRNLFQEIADMPADEQISSSLVDMRSKPFFEGDFTEEVLDDLSPLQKIVETAIKNSSPEVAELIKRNVNPKQLAQLSRGSGAIADIMVNGKASELEKIRAMLSEKYTGVYFDKFKPINAIIKSIGGDWKGLQTYAVAKLSKEMYEYNRAHPELETPLIPYTTEAAADATIKQGEAKFGEAQKDLVIYSKVLLAMEHDSGLITDNTFYRVLKSWKNYVPMAQVFDENEDYTKLDYLKRRKGHEGDTWSPIQIMIANTHRRIQACERNKVKLELANLVRFGGFDSNLSEVASSNPDADNIIRFRENGKIKYLETPDPAIKRAVDSLQSKSDGTWIAKMLRAITGFMRMRLTGGNLDFAAGNIFRDLPDAYIHNNQLGKDVFIIGDFMRAWGSAVKELIQDARGKGMSQDLIDWKMSGGAQASFVSGDVDYIQRSIDEATSTRLQRYRRKPFMQLLDDMQKISEFTESVTRLTTYKLAKGKLAKGRVATITDKQLAALAAREASVDFAKAGRSTRKVNQVVLFANAAVQSLNLWIEAGKEFRKGNSKPLFGKLFRAAAHGVLMAALQAAIAHAGDDDDKEAYEQAPNWEKETYWIFPAIKNPITGTALRIPKGFDFGMRFMANLTDETIGAAFDNKPFEGKRFWETFKGALPSLTATIISPAIEAYTNYSFFRDAPIVPLREQHLDATEQYDANSSWVAKTISKNTVPLAKIFGARTGWSPRKIDYMISGYLGSFISSILKPNTTDPDKFPMVRRFVFEPYKNPKIVKEYYEAYEEQTSHYNTYKLTKEKPDDFDPALYKRLKAANETMRKISNRERAIQNDENLSYTERRAKLVELEKKRVTLCEKVFNKAR